MEIHSVTVSTYRIQVMVSKLIEKLNISGMKLIGLLNNFPVSFNSIYRHV